MLVMTDTMKHQPDRARLPEEMTPERLTRVGAAHVFHNYFNWRRDKRESFVVRFVLDDVTHAGEHDLFVGFLQPQAHPDTPNIVTMSDGGELYLEVIEGIDHRTGQYAPNTVIYSSAAIIREPNSTAEA